MNDMKALQANSYVQKLRAKKTSEENQSNKMALKPQNQKLKKKKAKASKTSKKPQKSKIPGLDSGSATMVGIGVYKKIFVEHFEGNKYSNKSEIQINSNKSFESCYLGAIEVKLTSLHKAEKERFFNFLSQRDNFERIAILDEASKVFQAVADYVNQNPTALEKLDINKVLANIQEIKIKFEECRKILEHWNVIALPKEEKDSKQKKLETMELTDLKAFVSRLQLYEKLQKESQELSEASLAEVLAKSKVESPELKNAMIGNFEAETKSGDTSPEEELDSEKKYTSKDEKMEECSKICGQIEEIFSRDEALFDQVFNHLKESKVRSIFSFYVKNSTLKGSLLSGKALEDQENKTSDDSGWELFKKSIRKTSGLKIQKQKEKTEELYKLKTNTLETLNKLIVERVTKDPINLIAKASEKSKTPRVRASKVALSKQTDKMVLESSAIDLVAPSNVDLKMDKEPSTPKLSKRSSKKKVKEQFELGLEANLSGPPIKRKPKQKDPSLVVPKRCLDSNFKMDQEDKPSLISQVSTDANSKYDYLQTQPSRLENREQLPFFEQRPVENQQYYGTPSYDGPQMQGDGPHVQGDGPHMQGDGPYMQGGGLYNNQEPVNNYTDQSHYSTNHTQNAYVPSPMPYAYPQDPRRFMPMYYRPFCGLQQQKNSEQHFVEPQIIPQANQAYFAPIEPGKTINNTFVLQIPMIQNSPQFVQVIQNPTPPMMSVGNNTQYIFIPDQMNPNMNLQNQYQGFPVKASNLFRNPEINGNKFGMNDQHLQQNYPYAQGTTSYIQNEATQQKLNTPTHMQPMNPPPRIQNMNIPNQQYFQNGMYFQPKNQIPYFVCQQIPAEQRAPSYQVQDTAIYAVPKGQLDYTQNNQMIRPTQPEAVKFQNGGY